MKKFFLSSLLLFSLFTNLTFAQTATPRQATAAAPAKTSDKGIEVPFVNKKLANGLEVIVLPDSSIPLVTVELEVRNGSFTEPPEYNGLSHLFEHMFFKENQAAVVAECETVPDLTIPEVAAVCSGPMKLKPEMGDLSYRRNLNKLFAYNGTTREEAVNYFYHVTAPYLETAIRHINNSVRFPRFDAEDLEREKKVVIGELDRRESSPYGYLEVAMTKELFYQFPTRKLAQGTRESINGATVEKMWTIKDRYYFPNNSALIVTGDVKPEEVFRLAELVMGSWQPRKVDPFKEFPLVKHPPLPKSKGIFIEKKFTGEASQGTNVIINIGWHGPSVGEDDASTYAADVFSYIITQPDSRFQRNLVDKGLVSGVNFGYYTQRNVGPIALNLFTTPDKAKDAIKAVYAELNAFTQPDYFSNEELESAKAILESQDLIRREKLSEYAQTLGFWWSSTGIEYYRGYYKNLRSSSRADIDRYIKTYIQGKNHVAIAMMAPGVKEQTGLTEADLIGGAK